ncbi:hypothetical protein SteCoe_16516 [Stentor coeruleus]|uniref:DUSP domain-containing protein n=1 Tax=Stentor coeruleus TaxID=5963 RepID=A0A1R2C0Z6_9CILI|nr:hypothetical protein SteCoe_16516 [Stentor coeruleus]
MGFIKITNTEEKVLVESLMKEDVLSCCETAFMVTNSWWKEWESYATYNTEKPSNMRNYNLLKGFEIIAKDYKLLPTAVWEIFKNLYDYQPEVEVFIIDKNPDFYPANLYIKLPNTKRADMNLISLKITVGQLKKYIFAKYNYGTEIVNMPITAKSSVGSMNMKTLNEDDVLQNVGICSGWYICFGNDEDQKTLYQEGDTDSYALVAIQNEDYSAFAPVCENQQGTNPGFKFVGPLPYTDMNNYNPYENVEVYSNEEKEKAIDAIVTTLHRDKTQIGNKTLEEIENIVDNILDTFDNFCIE